MTAAFEAATADFRETYGARYGSAALLPGARMEITNLRAEILIPLGASSAARQTGQGAQVLVRVGNPYASVVGAAGEQPQRFVRRAALPCGTGPREPGRCGSLARSRSGTGSSRPPAATTATPTRCSRVPAPAWRRLGSRRRRAFPLEPLRTYAQLLRLGS